MDNIQGSFNGVNPAVAISLLMPYPACCLDVGRQILALNQAYVDVLGERFATSEAQLTGDCLAALLERSGVEQVLSEYDATGILAKRIVSGYIGENTYKIVSAVPVVGNSETPYLLLTEQDITSEFRSMNEEFLAYFHEIINHLPASVYWKDINSVVIGSNSVHTDLSGLGSSENVIGKTDYDFPWKDKAGILMENDQAVMQSREKLTFEETALLPEDDEEHIFLSIKAPLYNHQRDVVGVLGVSMDITERKALEANLKVAKEKAEEASRAKSDFIANMSHDFRTPLTGIIGLANNLKSELENENARDSIQLMEESSGQLLSLLNEILQTVETESGRLPDKVENFSIEQLTRGLFNLLSPTAIEKNVEIFAKLDAAVPSVLNGKKVLFERVLLNLVSNAIKFTGSKGEVHVDISVENTENNQVNLLVKVDDNGIGIADDKLDKIFDMFSRVTPSYQGVYQGSGLGLYIVKNYVSSLGGNISVESQLNQGSTFTLSLPFTVVDSTELGSEVLLELHQPGKDKQREVEPEKINDGADRVQSQGEDSSSVKVLLVEDTAIQAKIATQLLNRSACSVVHVGSGEEAVDIVRKEQFDFILMDIGLPGIDGLEATRMIRALKASDASSTPIIGLTAHVGQNKKNSCIQAGMQEMLSKPLSPEKLGKIIDQYKPSSNMEPASEYLEGDDMADIDLRLGAQIISSSEAAARELVDMLVESLNEDLPALETAITQKDLDDIYSAIHKIYGSFCYCGVPKLRAVGKDLKMAAKFRDLDHTLRLYQDFLSAVEDFRQAHGTL